MIFWNVTLTEEVWWEGWAGTGLEGWVGALVDKLGLLCTTVGRVQPATVEGSMVIPQRINKITIWSSNSTSVYIHKAIKSRVLKTYLYTHVHSSIIQNSHNEETTHVSIDVWIDKQYMIYTYKGICSALKRKEILIYFATQINLENMTLNKIS